MEKSAIIGQDEDCTEGSCPNDSHLYHKLLPVAKRILCCPKFYDEQVLVGVKESINIFSVYI